MTRLTPRPLAHLWAAFRHRLHAACATRLEAERNASSRPRTSAVGARSRRRARAMETSSLNEDTRRAIDGIALMSARWSWDGAGLREGRGRSGGVAPVFSLLHFPRSPSF